MCAIARMERSVKESNKDGDCAYPGVKYTSLTVTTERTAFGLQKFKFPKSIRLKLLGFLLLLLVPVFLLLIICLQSCDTNCQGLCNMSNLRPNFGRISNNNSANFHYPHTSRQLPKCIIIGVRKAGTRALLKYLSIHPNIVTVNKELHFFNMDQRYSLGLDYYRKQMPYTFKEQIGVEKTPAYYTESQVPERIYRMNKSIQLLLIVREPVTRLISDYVQLREMKLLRNKNVVPFEEEVLDEDGEVDMTYKGVRTSIYAKYYPNWISFFSPKQIHVIDGEKLVHDPYEEIHAVETFLGLEHRISRDNFFFNDTKGFFCIKDETLANSCLQKTKGRQHPPVDPDVLKKLYNFYRGYNKLFFSMVNKTFDWPEYKNP